MAYLYGTPGKFGDSGNISWNGYNVLEIMKDQMVHFLTLSGNRCQGTGEVIDGHDPSGLMGFGVCGPLTKKP